MLNIYSSYFCNNESEIFLLKETHPPPNVLLAEFAKAKEFDDEGNPNPPPLPEELAMAAAFEFDTPPPPGK